MFDNDREGITAANRIKKLLHVEPSRIVFVTEQKDHVLEDLFSHNDFNKYILGDIINGEKEIYNSKFMKSKNLDKVLIAKRFFEYVSDVDNDVSLDTNSQKAFDDLFSRINKVFK